MEYNKDTRSKTEFKISVIDAQGGGIGKQLVAALKQTLLEVQIVAAGTNSAATSAMLKAGAATGENAVGRLCTAGL